MQPALPAQGAKTSQQGHGSKEKLAFHLEQGNEHGRSVRYTDVILPVNIDQFSKKPRVDFLPDERLRHADAAH